MSEIIKSYREDTFESSYPVRPQEEGMRLDQFIKIHRPSFSRETIKKRIDEKSIKIIGRPGVHKPSTTVHEGETVVITVVKSIHEDEYWNGQKLILDEKPEIIYEDADLIVINKPPFMATHPAGRHLFHCATVIFEKKHGGTIHSIHRIDRETSGVLLLGKNPKIASRMTDLFINDQVRKCYFFISVIDQEKFKGELNFTAKERLDSPDEGAKRVVVKAYDKNSFDGKEAITHFKLLHLGEKYALGLAFPLTGRQHQIRVHAAFHGLPLLGDKLYLGGYPMFQRFKDNLATSEDHALMEIPRHALHATALNMPYGSEHKTFIAHIPHDLREWMEMKLSLKVSSFEAEMTHAIENYFKR